MDKCDPYLGMFNFSWRLKKQHSSNESVVKSLAPSFSGPGYTWFTGDKVTKTGKGKYVWADGDVYIGELKEGRQEGRGLLFSGGTVKKGLWFSGKWYQSADVKIEEFSSKILSDWLELSVMNHEKMQL